MDPHGQLRGAGGLRAPPGRALPVFWQSSFVFILVYISVPGGQRFVALGFFWGGEGADGHYTTYLSSALSITHQLW